MSPTTGKNKTILVVDDDEDIQTLLEHLLKRESFAVVRAYNGQQALDYLWKAESAVSLILLDLRMPVLDGWKFRTIQKSDPRIAQIPVVVITMAQTAENDIASIAAAAYFKKPIDGKLLIKTIRDHCL